MHLSIRPELHALASAWVSAAEDTASRKAVSLNAGIDAKDMRGGITLCKNLNVHQSQIYTALNARPICGIKKVSANCL